MLTPAPRRRHLLVAAFVAVGVSAGALSVTQSGSEATHTSLTSTSAAGDRSPATARPKARKAPATATRSRPTSPALVPTAPTWARDLPATTTQAVRTVRTNRWCSYAWCSRTEAWERVEGRWRIAQLRGEPAVFRSQIGTRGFAPRAQRRQDDLRTPAGVYKIVTTFSTTKDRPTAMPWRRRLPTSVVDLNRGRTYNTWIESRGNTSGDRRMMSWGLWIDYNNPRLKVGKGPRPISGRGSGIFMHTSNATAPFSATLGCVQIASPAQMAAIVRWLKPGANPRVVNDR
ncbi:MAG: L,D-transpeptidase family protein [Sporichthyaceae bacterium]